MPDIFQSLLNLNPLLVWWGVGLGAAVLWQTAMFALARRLKRDDVVDVGWGLSFIVLAWVWLWVSRSYLPGGLDNFNNWVAILTVVFVTIWGLRLSLHILKRFLRSTSEDRRYIELRQGWPSQSAFARYSRIFVAQAMLAAIIALPIFIIVFNTNQLAIAQERVYFIWLGLAMWLVGYICEVVADQQLRSFLNRRVGDKTLQSGLWKYSRHPNYFGELLLWWGIGVISLVFSPIGLIGPLLISYLIIFVSGIPPAERSSAKRSDWAEYKRRTSVLIPWPPRRNET